MASRRLCKREHSSHTHKQSDLAFGLPCTEKLTHHASCQLFTKLLGIRLGSSGSEEIGRGFAGQLHIPLPCLGADTLPSVAEAKL